MLKTSCEHKTKLPGVILPGTVEFTTDIGLALKGAELVLGRKPRGHWNSREIDLDLLYFGNRVMAGRPTIPHIEIPNRQFVLVPLNDIAPDWVDPLSNCTMKDLLSQLLQKEGKIEFRTITAEEP